MHAFFFCHFLLPFFSSRTHFKDFECNKLTNTMPFSSLYGDHTLSWSSSGCSDSHNELSRLERESIYYERSDMTNFVRSELMRRKVKKPIVLLTLVGAVLVVLVGAKRPLSVL